MKSFKLLNREVTEKKKVKKDDAAGEPASKKAKYEDETKTVKKVSILFHHTTIVEYLQSKCFPRKVLIRPHQIN